MPLTLPQQNVVKKDSPFRTTKRVRVGFILHAMQVAGAEMLVMEIIRQLENEIDPAIFCLDAVGELGERLQQQGIPIVCLHRKAGRDWGLARRLARAVREFEINVVHAHQYTPFFYAALARLFGQASFQLIFTEHGRHYPDVVLFKRRLLNRLLLSKYADSVNAVCQFSARALQQVDGFNHKPIQVIQNGIHWQRYQGLLPKDELRHKLGLNLDRKYIICVARFHPVKDHATLLRGFALVAAQMSDVDLLLAGDGRLRKELESLTHQLGIQDRVQFLGIRSDVPELLQAADIFTLTSLSEAASLTLLEAMATGLPVIVTNVGGNPEIVRQGMDGLLVSRQNEGELAQAFITLLQDPSKAKAMGVSGRDLIQQQYSLERTIAQYGRLYLQLASQS